MNIPKKTSPKKPQQIPSAVVPSCLVSEIIMIAVNHDGSFHASQSCLIMISSIMMISSIL